MVCLNCAEINKGHTADNVAKLLLYFLEDWEINRKRVVEFTTDSKANILKVINNLDLC